MGGRSPVPREAKVITQRDPRVITFTWPINKRFPQPLNISFLVTGIPVRALLCFVE